MGSLLQDVLGLFSKKKYVNLPYEVSKDDYFVLSTKGESALNVMAYLPKVEQQLISAKQFADAIVTATNTTYDFANADAGGKTKLTLTGSDSTIDTVNLVGGTGVTIASTGSDVDISVTPGTYVECTGTNTAYTIPLWNSDGTCSLIDSAIVFDGNNMYTLDASRKLKVNWLEMPVGVINASNGTGGVGQVLTSNAAGNIEWTTNGTGSMSSWRIDADTGTLQVITDGDTVTIAGGVKLSTSVAGTTVTANHNATTRVDTASAVSPAEGGTFTVVDTVTQDATGHPTAVNVKTITLPVGPAGTVTSVTSGSANTITIGGTATDPTVAAITSAVTNGGLNLATGDDIYDFVIGLGYVESVAGGLGINISGTAADPIVDIDYAGADNAIIIAPTATPVASDYLWFSDTNDNSDIKKGLVSSLPFSTTQGIVTTLTTNNTSGVATLAGGVLNIPNYAVGGGGSVTSVSQTHGGNAFTVGGSPVTSSGTLAITMAGNSTQYVNGAGDLITFPTIPAVPFTSLTTIGGGAATLVSGVLNVPTPGASAFTSLTTTGTSGVSTLTSGVLNVPNYANTQNTLTTTGSGAATLSGTVLNIPTPVIPSVPFTSLTTTGTSGPSTLTSGVLNIPQYTGGGGTVTAVTGTLPIISTGGTTPAISINTMTAATAGAGGLKGAVPASAAGDQTKFLRADATWQTVPSGYVLPVATTVILGGVKLFNDVDQAVSANAVTEQAGRTYGLQLNGSDQGVINVPWTDTNVVASITTTGTSGAATLISGVLNIPNYATSGGGVTSVTFALTSGNTVPLSGSVAGNVLNINSNVYGGGARVGHVPPSGSAGLFLEGNGNWTSPTTLAAQAGCGLTIDSSTTPDTFAVNYAGTSSVVFCAPTAGGGEPTIAEDYMIYHDSKTTTDKKALLSSLWTQFIAQPSVIMPVAYFSVNNLGAVNSGNTSYLGTVTHASPSTGLYTVNWTVPMANVQYLVNVTTEGQSSQTDKDITVVISDKSTSSFTIFANDSTGARLNAMVNVVMYK